MKKTSIRCPRCGSSDTAKIIYGKPHFDEEMQRNLDSGKWVLGGCCLRAAEVNGKTISLNPARRCNACGKDFGEAPVLLNRKTGQAEDYRDVVTSVTLTVEGFFVGHKEISVKKEKSGAMLHVFVAGPGVDIEDSIPDRQLTEAEWRSFLDTLYGKLYLNEWKKRYIIPGVLDGTQWSLKLQLTNGRKRVYEGDNDYPPYWSELLKVFYELSGCKML